MRHRRCQLPLGTGPSLTRRDLVDRVGLADLVVRDPVDPGLAVLAPVGPGDLAVLAPVGLADPVDLGLEGRAVLHPVDPAAHIRVRVDPDPVARVDLDPADLEGQVGRAVLRPVDLAVPAHTRGPVGRVDPVGRVGLDLAGLVDLGMNPVDPVGLDLAGRADLVDQGMNRVDPVGLVGPADLADRASPVIRAGRHRRPTRLGVLSIAVARRWAARGMCRTASAHPVTVRRRRPHSVDGVGMAGLHPERRRLGGMDRRPRVVGTVRHLPVVGMSDGMGRTATKALRSVISGRSTTTGTARFRCSTRCSGDGASGSSGSGFRCTDTTPTFTAFGPC